jgi:L-alanine-DL-glutamate epimerase-like enolase superfamily enzyme
VRINSLETVAVALPFRERYLTATGSLDRREMLIVRVRDSDGATGFGDAVPLSLRGGSSLSDVQDQIDRVCAANAVGTEIDGVEAITSVVASCVAAGAGRPAVAGVEMALLDLLGKVDDAPVWRLLGATEASAVECNGTIGADEPARAAALAGNLTAAGFKTLKIKVGAGDDLERMQAVRDASGRKTALRIDANGAWGVHRAASMLVELEAIGLELAEQPCASARELVELRERAAVPIVADESAETAQEAVSAFGSGACDAVTIKLAKVGGIGAALKIADSVPAYLSSALDSPLGIVAAFHAAQIMPARGFATGLAHGLATSGLFADNVADGEAFIGPRIEPPTGPGLGIDVDEAAVERLRIR